MSSEIIHCVVYWVKSEKHTDILTEGYVGITTVPDQRFKQHLSNARTNSHHKYGNDFREHMLKGMCSFNIILRGDLEYCLDIERKLRPTTYIGWNQAIGGDGGVNYRHGLTGSTIAKTYYNILTRAKQEDEHVYEEWLGSDGIVEFARFYSELADESGELTLNVVGNGYTPTNIIRMPRSEIIRRAYRKHDIGDGKLYSVAELGEMFNIKPNTISTRLKRGWSLKEAIGAV